MGTAQILVDSKWEDKRRGGKSREANKKAAKKAKLCAAPNFAQMDGTKCGLERKNGCSKKRAKVPPGRGHGRKRVEWPMNGYKLLENLAMTRDCKKSPFQSKFGEEIH